MKKLFLSLAIISLLIPSFSFAEFVDVPLNVSVYGGAPYYNEVTISSDPNMGTSLVCPNGTGTIDINVYSGTYPTKTILPDQSGQWWENPANCQPTWNTWTWPTIGVMGFTNGGTFAVYQKRGPNTGDNFPDGNYWFYAHASDGNSFWFNFSMINGQITAQEEPPAEPTCFDGIQNQNETGIDIGGVCEEPEPEVAFGLHFFGGDNAPPELTYTANDMVASVASAIGLTIEGIGPILAVVIGVMLALVLGKKLINLFYIAPVIKKGKQNDIS